MAGERIRMNPRYEEGFGSERHLRISQTVSFKAPMVDKTIATWKPARKRKSCKKRCTRTETGGFCATNFGIITVSILWCYCIPPNLFPDGSSEDPERWGENIWRRIIFSIGLIFSSMSLLSLWLTYITDPGVLPRQRELEKRRLKPGERNCISCNIIRPPRAKHCRHCDHCVEVFDHHCPYAGVCIGDGNYLFFCLLLLCGMISNLYSVIFCIWFLKDNWSSRTWDSLKFQLIVGLSLTIVSTFVFLLIFQLSAYHVVIVVAGETTNERVKASRKKLITNVDREPLLGVRDHRGSARGVSISLSITETKDASESYDTRK